MDRKIKNDSLFKEIESMIPKRYYKRKRINIYITCFLFVCLLISLVFSVYYNKNFYYWISVSIIFLLTFFIPLLLTKSNCNSTIKSLKKSVKNKFNHKVKINKKELYKKRSSFIENLLQQIYEQIKN